MKTYVDTNILLRHFTNDIPSQTKTAQKLLKTAKHIVIPTVVIAETVYFLENHYKIDKTSLCVQIGNFLNLKRIEVSSYVFKAFKLYQHHAISFCDSLIVAEALEAKASFKTFDQKLLRVFRKYQSRGNS